MFALGKIAGAWYIFWPSQAAKWGLTKFGARVWVSQKRVVVGEAFANTAALLSPKTKDGPFASHSNSGGEERAAGG